MLKELEPYLTKEIPDIEDFCDDEINKNVIIDTQEDLETILNCLNKKTNFR